MADSGKNAQSTHSGTGAQTTFAIGFGFLASANVGVFVGSVPASRPYTANQTAGTDYNIVGTDVVFTAGSIPAEGTDNIIIWRDSIHPTPHVTFADSSPITAAQFTQSIQQSLYYTEEVEDQT